MKVKFRPRTKYLLKTKYPFTENGFIHGFRSVIMALGFPSPSKPRVMPYPHSFKDDLEAVGADMWRAFETERNEREKQARTT